MSKTNCSIIGTCVACGGVVSEGSLHSCGSTAGNFINLTNGKVIGFGLKNWDRRGLKDRRKAP